MTRTPPETSKLYSPVNARDILHPKTAGVGFICQALVWFVPQVYTYFFSFDDLVFTYREKVLAFFFITDRHMVARRISLMSMHMHCLVSSWLKIESLHYIVLVTYYTVIVPLSIIGQDNYLTKCNYRLIYFLPKKKLQKCYVSNMQ